MRPLFLMSLFALSASDSLTWTDSVSGAQYDWSSLRKKEPWVVLAPTSDDVLTTEYTFSLGENLKSACSMCLLYSEPASAIERDIVYGETFEECSVLGRHEMSQVRLLDSRDPEHGVEVTYSGGHICSSVERMVFNEPRKIVFQLLCAKDGIEGEFRQVDSFPFDLSECEVVLERVTTAGCPVKYVPVAWSRKWKVGFVCELCRITFVLGIYFAIGTCANCLNGATGCEVVPHMKLLIKGAYCISAGISYLGLMLPNSKSDSDKEYERVCGYNPMLGCE